MGDKKLLVRDDAQVMKEAPYLTSKKTWQEDLQGGAEKIIEELMKKGLGLGSKSAILQAYPSDDGRLYFRFKEDFNSPKFPIDKKKPDDTEKTIYFELKRAGNEYSVTAVNEIKYNHNNQDKYFEDARKLESNLKVNSADRYYDIFFSTDKSQLEKTAETFTNLTKNKYEIKETTISITQKVKIRNSTASVKKDYPVCYAIPSPKADLSTRASK